MKQKIASLSLFISILLMQSLCLTGMQRSHSFSGTTQTQLPARARTYSLPFDGRQPLSIYTRGESVEFDSDSDYSDSEDDSREIALLQHTVTDDAAHEESEDSHAEMEDPDEDSPTDTPPSLFNRTSFITLVSAVVLGGFMHFFLKKKL